MLVIDISGSMTWNYVTPSLTAVTAATFGAVVALSNRDKVDLYTVDNKCVKVPVEGNSPFQLARAIKERAGGGTYFETIMSQYQGQKYVIILTDSEQADNFEYRWRKAKNQTEQK